MSVILYGFAVSPFVRAARAALALAGVPYEFKEISFDYLGTPEYRAVHPFGKMPALSHDGFVVYETAAILAYIDEALGKNALLPKSAKDRANAARWISIAGSYLYPVAVMQIFMHRIMLPVMGGTPDDAVVATGVTATAAHLDVLEAELKAKANPAFIAGDAVSTADLMVASMLDLLALAKEGADLIARRPHVAAWLKGVKAHGDFAKTFPVMLESAAQAA